jgi:hypothetical protein
MEMECSEYAGTSEAGFWECGNEPSSSIKAKEHLDYLTTSSSRDALLD